MKKIAGLFFVLLLAIQAGAQIKKTYQRVKQAVTGSARLAELHYFPKPWEADLNFAYRYTALNIKGNSAGLTVVDADQNQSTLKSSLALGLSDQVFVQMGWDYLLATDINYTKPSSQSSLRYKGLQDPDLAAIFRVLNADSFKLDLKGAVRISTGDSEEADANHDGNAKDGGHALTAGAKMIALVTESSQISANLDYKMIGVSNSVDQTSKQTSEFDQHNEMLIELATMTELTTNLFFGVLLEIARVDGYKKTNLITKAATNTGSVSGKTLNAVGKYELTPDSLFEAQMGYLIDYSSTSNGVDVSATGSSLTASYLVRF